VAKVPGTGAWARRWRRRAPVFRAVRVHAHSHEQARLSNAPVSDFAGFWGRCSCCVLCNSNKSAGPMARRYLQQPSTKEFLMSNVPYNV
jgi:hypothetical protein